MKCCSGYLLLHRLFISGTARLLFGWVIVFCGHIVMPRFVCGTLKCFSYHGTLSPRAQLKRSRAVASRGARRQNKGKNGSATGKKSAGFSGRIFEKQQLSA